MKNISLILNIVLLVAVAVLFYLHFSGTKPKGEPASAAAIPSDIKIAYVNTDTLMKYYDFVNERRDIMKAKANRLQQDFEKRRAGLESEVGSYRRNEPNMTVSQLNAAREDLAKKEQNLQLFGQRISQEVMNDEARINQELYDKVVAYCKKYGEDNGIQVILKFDPTSDVLYSASVLDVTKDLLEGLNSEYKGAKPGAAKTDSTSVKK